ncbi:MAG TPA: SDR family oxidoreductase [Polyangiales bacterium]|nr:SDR family oxidoreductase [Polyangiales bacterium]
MKNLFSVEGKVALVTGGSRGIGYMIARGYVENGATTYITARKADACEAAAKELSAFGRCISIPCDVSTSEGVKQLSKALLEREPKLDILVNNAGANWAEPIDVFAESGWDKVMDVNLKSVFFLTRELLPALRAAGTKEDPARVINIGSIDGLHVPGLETYAYSSSKAAVHHLTRVLARRLAGEHVNVNAVAPGPFESKMMAATLKNFGDAIARAVPRGRIGEPEDMAGVAIYLASRASAYVTGTVIAVDGGLATTV